MDRISKIPSQPDHLRVEEARDALDDDAQGGGAFEEGDDFEGNLINRTNWKVLLNDPAQANLKKIDLPVGAVRSLKFLSVNLKNNPALVAVKLDTNDGRVFQTAYLILPRHRAMLFQSLKGGVDLKVKDVTEGDFLSCFVSDSIRENEESTRLYNLNEKTFSQTLGRLLPRTLAIRMGLRDPETHQTVTEVVVAYVVGILVLTLVGLGVYWIFI